jgi:hypothetical protein
MSDETITCSEIEHSSLSDLQKKNHEIDPKIDEQFETLFDAPDGKRTWYSNFLHPAVSSQIGKEIIYKVLPTASYLSTLTMRQVLPALKIKDEFKGRVQICWPHNCANNIIEEGSFIYGSSFKMQTINSEYLDDYLQFFTEPEHKKALNEMQGNLPFLEEWSDFLPAYSVKAIHPYFFTTCTETAFPIFRIHPDKELFFKYTIRDSLRELLRMRIKGKSGWKEIKFNAKYIEGNYGSVKLSPPQILAYYYKISPEEIAMRSQEQKYIQMVDDIISIDTEYKHKLGDKVDIALHSKDPCRFFTVKARKDRFFKNRNYSNYTTFEELKKGWSPIVGFPYLKYGDVYKFKDIPYDVTSELNPLYYCNRVPWEKGYNIFSFSSKTYDCGFDTGVILSNTGGTGIKVELGDTDPFKIDLEVDAKTTKFDDDKLDEDFSEDEQREKEEVEEDEEIETNDNFDVRKNCYSVICRVTVSRTLAYVKNAENPYYYVKFEKHVNKAD